MNTKPPMPKLYAYMLVFAMLAAQLQISGAWSALQQIPVFAPVIGVSKAEAQSMPPTFSLNGTDVVRAFANQHGANVPTSFDGMGQVRLDAPTLFKLCNLAGYSNVQSYACTYGGENRCNFTSCGNNYLVGWNGSSWVRGGACGGAWIAQMTCNTPFVACNDGKDNDGDGKIDLQDPGCSSATDTDETDPKAQCQDGIDNDNDGATDFPADFSCSSATDNDETNPKAQCQDGADNDGDGLVDFPQDPGCTSKQDNDEFNAAQCQDGIDNDGDGATDMSDFSCSSPTDNDETNPKAQCQDGVDNDSDGLIDFPQDPGCASKQDNDEFNAVNVDLSLTKTGPASVVRGQSISYTLAVQNTSQVQATNVVVTDQIPAGLTYNDFNSYASCSQQGSNVVCDLGTINANQSASFTITFDTPTIANCTNAVNVVNTATISSTQTDSNQANNTASTQLNPTRIDCPFVPPCQDGVDNDGDGATDFPADFSCSSPTDNDETNPKAACQDGIDNDSDGLVDFPQDPGCASKQDNDESNPSNITLTSVTANGCQATVSYSKNFDTCAHLLTSFNGQITHSQNVFCGRNGPVTVPTSTFNSFFQVGTSVKLCHGNNYNDCSAPVTITGTTQCVVPQCRNGIDDDGDGRVDFPADPGCSNQDDNTEGGDPACADRQDNDGDGLVDFPQDPGCSSLSDTDEFNAPTPACRDGLDNDFDGRVDMQDPGCSHPDDTNEGDDPACADRQDNDNDGLIDFPFDPGCSSLSDTDEFNQVQTVDLSIQKTGPASVTRGQTIFYTLTVGNAGSIQASNVVVTDQIPTGLTYNDALSYGPCSQQGNAVVCNLNTLVANQFGSFLIAFDAPTIQNCTTVNVVNTATISGTQQDSNQSNNTASTQNAPTRVDCPVVQAQCQDGQDNDFDGRTDTLDPGCSSPMDTNEGDEPQCIDGRDNDQDGKTDFPQDPGCVSPTDDDEFSAPLGQCQDGIDNDQDGRVDFPADPGCSSPTDTNEGDEAACQDRRDNDFDGLVDWPLDPGCTGPTDTDEFNAPVSQCSDGVDNDGDWRVDMQDPGCSSPTDTSEGDDPACADRQDNDGDGLVDFPQDPGCSSLNDTDEFNAPAGQCQDGIDNDFDGKVDMQDPGCSSPQDNNEGDDPTQYGCIEILKETFDPTGNRLPIAAQFTFTLDASRITYNDASGRARFDQVLPGQHTVSELIPSGWTQFLVTPSGGTVNVTAGTNCAAVVFKNKQVFVSNAQCADGFDNDGDGLKDYPADPGCSSAADNDEFSATFLPQCQDGIDNDGDGLKDHPQDPGCASADDNNEQNQAVNQFQQQVQVPAQNPIPVIASGAACSDGVDNDNDGLKDYPQDSGCTSSSDDDEFNFRSPRCSDGVDNDGDNLKDFPQDSGCTTPYDDNEYNDRLIIDRWREFWNWNW